MNSRWHFMVVLVVLLVLGSSGALHAEKGKTHSQKSQAMKKSATVVEMTPEQKAMMEKMEKLGAPGENHRVLDGLVGKWQAQVKWWMQPDAAPEESAGVSQNSWALGNHFLRQDYKGKTAMGQPFEGVGMIGYDNIRGEYQSVWMDSMSTGMMMASGTYDRDSKTLTENGSASCMMSGEKNKTFRSHLKMIDKDHMTYEMYSKTPEGKEFKMMEIAYERAKSPRVSKR